MDGYQQDHKTDKNNIDSSNVGFKLLQKFGWSGKGLGKAEQGIQIPVEVQETTMGVGLGKQAEYQKNAIEATRERKKLDSEIVLTAEEIQKRSELAEKKNAIELDVKKMNHEFFCIICERQYKNCAEMEEHLSSYAHHHKKRLKETKQREKELTSKRTKMDSGVEASDAKLSFEEIQMKREMKRHRIESQKQENANSVDTSSVRSPSLSESENIRYKDEINSSEVTSATVSLDANVLSGNRIAQMPVKFKFSMKK